MIKEIKHDPILLAGKSQVAADLPDTLMQIRKLCRVWRTGII